MQNAAPFQTNRHSRGYTFGGREVLRITCDMPQGNSRAATHFEKLLTLWQAFAEHTLLPQASAAWLQHVREGRAFAFSPHLARGQISIIPLKRCLKIEFSATLSVGAELRFSRTLTTLWDKEGKRQYKRAPHRFARRAKKKR